MGIIWLSHVLDQTTPLYGGSRDIILQSKQSLRDGDNCNTTSIMFSSHSGTHVDTPYHFFTRGKTVSDFPSETWVFTSPKCIDISVKPGQLLTIGDLSNAVSPDARLDILLLRTGFESNREDQIYWKEGPGLSSKLARYLRTLHPSLRAIGIDFISISSFQHREEGRTAHREFLENEILLFEDMALGQLDKTQELYQIIALPLRFANADGAPCTILGWEKDNEKI
jgi:kynurenine formamidase